MPWRMRPAGPDKHQHGAEWHNYIARKNISTEDDDENRDDSDGPESAQVRGEPSLLGEAAWVSTGIVSACSSNFDSSSFMPTFLPNERQSSTDCGNASRPRRHWRFSNARHTDPEEFGEFR